MFNVYAVMTTFFTVLGELKVFRTSYMSGYLMEPIRDNYSLKGAIRNIKKAQKGNISQKGDFQRDGCLAALLSKFFQRLKVFRTLHMSWYLVE